jgi:hypothetical protein
MTTSRSKVLWEAKCDVTTSTMSSSLTIVFYKINITNYRWVPVSQFIVPVYKKRLDYI